MLKYFRNELKRLRNSKLRKCVLNSVQTKAQNAEFNITVPSLVIQNFNSNEWIYMAVKACMKYYVYVQWNGSSTMFLKTQQFLQEMQVNVTICSVNKLKEIRVCGFPCFWRCIEEGDDEMQFETEVYV